MDLTKQKITLNDAEIKDAIKEYINRHSNVDCISAISFNSSNYTSASCEVELKVLDVLTKKEKSIEYGLRHTESQFLVNSILFKNDKIILGIGNEGIKWKSIKSIFASFKDILVRAEKGQFTPYGVNTNNNIKEKIMQAKDQLKEDLLQFEIVEFGEVKKQEMTFHLDELAKI